MPTILVTGSSRGIGIELVRQYAARNWRVIATVRKPETADDVTALSRTHSNIEIERLDVTQPGQAFALAKRLRGVPIDVLLQNAGIAPGRPEQSRFGTIDFALAREVMETNLWPALWIAEALLENVLRSEQRKIMVMSSAAGSISGLARSQANNSGGYYLYRMSKASLNMAVALMARDLAPRQVTVGLLSPGQVDTDLGRGGASSPPPGVISAEQSVTGLMKVIDEFSLDKSGKFIRYTGLEVPW